MTKYKLKYLASYSQNKINTNLLDKYNYISTDNMLSNFGGIVQATSIPKNCKVCKFEIGNILLSNIRPYFKKIYYSKINGGCSNDVLCFQVNNTNIIHPKYLFYVMTSNQFINYVVSTSKGTKMPRGDKKAILDYNINVPSLEYQHYIVDIIGSIDDKIENNQKLINKLDKILLLKFKKIYLKASKSNLTINLNSIVTLKTGKKDANASIENGKYPFFTCSEKESSINVYSFDQEAILIAGNGNMSVKYYNGKFDAYQRTYVISSDKYFYYLYLYYKSFINDISIGAKGSVIKFLTKSLLLDINLPILNDNLMNEFEQNVKIILNYMLMLEKENSELIYLKQLYLKKFFR